MIVGSHVRDIDVEKMAVREAFRLLRTKQTPSPVRMPVPPATEGVPRDATDREVQHLLGWYTYEFWKAMHEESRARKAVRS